MFYNIEYNNYIIITHGACYFKYFLYKRKECYELKKIDKILIPPSEKIRSFVINLDEKKILNLPKWNNYNLRNNSVTDYSKNIINYNNSILIMLFGKILLKIEK